MPSSCTSSFIVIRTRYVQLVAALSIHVGLPRVSEDSGRVGGGQGVHPPDSPYVQDVGLFGRGWPFGGPDVFWENAVRTHGGAAWPPRGPQAPLRVRVRDRVGVRVGLVWADVQG